MVRVKRGVSAKKGRKNLFKNTKGFKWGRKNLFRMAKQAVMKAWSYAYRDRKVKKREKRKLWQTHIGAVCKEKGLSYSKFIKKLKDNKIELDRKILSQLANEHPEILEEVIKKVK